MRRRSGRGQCILTDDKALYPSPFPQSPCSSRLQHTASPSTLRMHTYSTLPCLHMERRGRMEGASASERARGGKGGGEGELSVRAALLQRSPTAAGRMKMLTHRYR